MVLDEMDMDEGEAIGDGSVWDGPSIESVLLRRGFGGAEIVEEEDRTEDLRSLGLLETAAWPPSGCRCGDFGLASFSASFFFGGAFWFPFSIFATSIYR